MNETNDLKEFKEKLLYVLNKLYNESEQEGSWYNYEDDDHNFYLGECTAYENVMKLIDVSSELEETYNEFKEQE